MSPAKAVCTLSADGASAYWVQPVCTQIVCQGTPYVANAALIGFDATLPHPVGSFASVLCNIGFISTMEPAKAICTISVDGVNADWSIPVCINFNECASRPCQNGGVCVDGINSFQCRCITPYFGPICSNKPAPICSWTRGAWQSPARGNNAGALLDACFVRAFPTGVIVGAHSPRILLTSPVAVRTLLKNLSGCGTAGIFLCGFTSITNPTTSSSSWRSVSSGGQLLAQLLTAKLNVGLDRSTCTARYPVGRTVHLGDLVIIYSCKFNGLSVDQIIAIADRVISGDIVRVGGSVVTPVQLASALTTINENYNGCTVDRRHLGVRL
jgi:hypothetical protein